MTFQLQEDMKSMPRVGTFLKGVLSYHTTHPTEKDVERSKKQAKVRNIQKSPFLYVTVCCHLYFSVRKSKCNIYIIGTNKRSVVKAFIDSR